ncbi:MAG: hypothetical protein AB1449_08590 [Chloroflexota bacterium]
MKKWLIGAAAAIVAVGLVAGGAAFAAYRASTRTEVVTGLPGVVAPWSGMLWDWDDLGKLHDYFLDALAEGLGLTREDLDARLADGESLVSIAEDQGLTADGIRDLWQEVKQKALDAAVADGVLTQEQADWLLQHMRRLAFGFLGRRWYDWEGAPFGLGEPWRGRMPFIEPNRLRGR